VKNWFPSLCFFEFNLYRYIVARKGAVDEDDGWVVALVHDAEYEKSEMGGRGTEMVIIDAKKFAEGPVARLRLPTYVPFGRGCDKLNPVAS
jgi:all-trans-8'-apo-beta-carotenal 15,15'-oxygenase